MEIRVKHTYLAILLAVFCMSGCDSGDASDMEVTANDDSNTSESNSYGGDDDSIIYNTSDETVGGTVPTTAEAVDLGLPSGTLWAPYNVGATSSGEAGAYFAWGETTASKKGGDGNPYYFWFNYKWTEDNGRSFTKYTTDGKTTLDLVDDAAAVNWGGKWIMPNRDQLKELFDNCSVEWKAEGGYADGSLAGYLLTSMTNGKKLFLPAAGYCWYYELTDVGSSGYYLSADLCFGDSHYAGFLEIRYGSWDTDNSSFRYIGQSVRPVVSSSAD